MAYTKTLSSETAEILGVSVDGCAVTFFLQEFHGATQFCGAASAQMVLDSIGSGVIDQRGLFDLIAIHSELDPQDHWHSAPDGIVSTLNELKPASLSSPFHLQEFTSEAALSRSVCWSVECGVAPIVLLSGGSHWVVIVGFTASRKPIGEIDDEFDILRFEVFDPAVSRRTIEYAEPTTPDGMVVKEYWTDTITPVEVGTWIGKFLVVRHSGAEDHI